MISNYRPPQELFTEAINITKLQYRRSAEVGECDIFDILYIPKLVDRGVK